MTDESGYRAHRFHWFPIDELTYRWRPLMRGGDEFGNVAIGIRLPGGMLLIALNVPLRTELEEDPA